MKNRFVYLCVMLTLTDTLRMVHYYLKEPNLKHTFPRKLYNHFIYHLIYSKSLTDKHKTLDIKLEK